MKRVENAQNDGGGVRGWFRGDFSNRFVTEDSDLSCDFNANRRVFLTVCMSLSHCCNHAVQPVVTIGQFSHESVWDPL